MKSAILALVLSSILSVHASELSIQCYYQYTNQTLNLLETMPTNACHADLVWGKDNVCFTGDIDAIIELMNSGQLNRRSSGLLVAKAFKAGPNTIKFTGVDQQSFWQMESSLRRCQ